MAKRHTDVAALAAGMVAVAVSMLVAPGPYDTMGAVVALTLLLLLVGFLADHQRNPIQSLGVAALGGLVALHLVGFAVEAVHTPDPVDFIVHNDFPGYRAYFRCDGKECESRVDGAIVLETWVAVLIVTYVADRAWQRRRGTAAHSARVDRTA